MCDWKCVCAAFDLMVELGYQLLNSFHSSRYSNNLGTSEIVVAGKQQCAIAGVFEVGNGFAFGCFEATLSLQQNIQTTVCQWM